MMGWAVGAVQRLLEVVTEVLHCGYSMLWLTAPGKKRREAVPAWELLHGPLTRAWRRFDITPGGI